MFKKLKTKALALVGLFAVAGAASAQTAPTAATTVQEFLALITFDQARLVFLGVAGLLVGYELLRMAVIQAMAMIQRKRG